MTQPGMTGRVNRGDDGATLILVLLLVTVVALGLSALLSLTDTSIRTTVNLRDVATANYDADGAVQAAVNSIRNSGFLEIHLTIRHFLQPCRDRRKCPWFITLPEIPTT